MNKRYEGRRDLLDGKIEVWVVEGERAHRLTNPIGGNAISFDWGLRNHRAQQLGYAICLDALNGDHVRAHRAMGYFAWQHLATIKQNDWAFDHEVVVAWIEEIERKRGMEASA